MHCVAVVALPGVVPFDLSVPCEVFGRARLADGRLAYQVVVCGPTPIIQTGHFALQLHHGLRVLRRAETIVLAGVSDPAAAVPAALVRALKHAAARGVRIASICSGAFVLAATGLLDGKRATTHWLAAAALAARHPAIGVDANVLYVDEGQFLTSAGAAAGLDLCLHLVRRDHGAAVALATARLSVMPLERQGGQAQFIDHALPAASAPALASTLQWMERHLAQPLPLSAIAKHAGMSVRHLGRHFIAQTGSTPLQWLLQARVRRAQALLERTSLRVEQVSEQAGFGSPIAFRLHFRRSVGTSPTAYRTAFGNGKRDTSAPTG